jgi:hypothetical protein
MNGHDHRQWLIYTIGQVNIKFLGRRKGCIGNVKKFIPDVLCAGLGHLSMATRNTDYKEQQAVKSFHGVFL